MAHLIQVGAGSGGMPVLDMLARDERITHVTLIEPDVYKTHNVHRHVFPAAAVGAPKAELARTWLLDRRPELTVDLFPCDLLDPQFALPIQDAIARADLGVCAADNEKAKFHFDHLLRRAGKPWTLGEVLSGGIGGFVHVFQPGGPCYGCVASHLQRNVTVDQAPQPDYSQPGGPIHEVTIPASKASIEIIAGLHAHLTLELLEASFVPGFTSLLLPLKKVPGIFPEAFRPLKFPIQRSPDCLFCRQETSADDDLDRALDQALDRLAHG